MHPPSVPFPILKYPNCGPTCLGPMVSSWSCLRRRRSPVFLLAGSWWFSWACLCTGWLALMMLLSACFDYIEIPTFWLIQVYPAHACCGYVEIPTIVGCFKSTQHMRVLAMQRTPLFLAVDSSLPNTCVFWLRRDPHYCLLIQVYPTHACFGYIEIPGWFKSTQHMRVWLYRDPHYCWLI